MFGDIWSGILETGGEIVDTAVDIGGEYLGHKLAADAASANPEENRTPAEYAPEQPNGVPVAQPTAEPFALNKWAVAAGLLIGAVILAKK